MTKVSVCYWQLCEAWCRYFLFFREILINKFANVNFIYYICILIALNMKKDVIVGYPLNGGTEV